MEPSTLNNSYRLFLANNLNLQSLSADVKYLNPTTTLWICIKWCHHLLRLRLGGEKHTLSSCYSKSQHNCKKMACGQCWVAPLCPPALIEHCLNGLVLLQYVSCSSHSPRTWWWWWWWSDTNIADSIEVKVQYMFWNVPTGAVNRIDELPLSLVCGPLGSTEPCCCGCSLVFVIFSSVYIDYENITLSLYIYVFFSLFLRIHRSFMTILCVESVIYMYLFMADRLERQLSFSSC